MGKADKLRVGAQRTGRGIFAGMKALEDAETANESNVTQSDDTESESRETETVNTEKEESTPDTAEVNSTERTVDVEAVKTAPEPVIEEPAETVEAQVEAAVNETPDIKDKINNISNEPKNKGSKSGSRYEKDKFLLLDIRGYRDYVEHMAKAANMSATKYIRNLIEMDKRKNNEIYEAHKALEEKLRGTWQS